MGNEDNKKEKEVLIKHLRDRLQWYTYEAAKDEFDVEEIETIVDLLAKLEPIEQPEFFNAEKAQERFWKYYEQREHEEHYRELAEIEVEDDEDISDKGEVSEETENEIEEDVDVKKDVVKPNSKRKKRSGRKYKAFAGIAVAVLFVFVLAFLNTSGAYAERYDGFFHWLRKDESGVEMIISPTSSEFKTNTFDPVRYDLLDDMPLDYKKLMVWMPEEYPDMIQFNYAEVISFDRITKIIYNFAILDSSNHLKVGLTIYDEGVVFQRQKYDTYKFLYTEEGEGYALEFFSKENDDGKEYAICFYDGNKQYFVQGNSGLEQMELLAKDYADCVLN